MNVGGSFNLGLVFLETGTPEDGLAVGTLLMSVLGGLALFLFGMDQMATALKVVAGDSMKQVLAKLTKNRFTAVITGAFVTAVIQSSSVTTVLVVGFITAGLMSMAQSIGVIMGANIGTTVTAQIIAFKVTEYALLLVALGFALQFIWKKGRIREHGKGLMGLGLVFFGMAVMSDAMYPLREYEPFLEWMTRMNNPMNGILAGAAFTALIQSSSATTGVIIAMASQGFIALPAGIAIAFGANIGTCVTALLAAIGKPREAIRAALVHVLFNCAGVLVWVMFIEQLSDVVTSLSPSADEGVVGLEKLAKETPRQIANAHTIFNIANTLIFVGLSVQFARLVEWLVPDRPIGEEEVVRTRYLDDELLSTPSLALDRVRLEILQLGERVMDMLEGILPAMLSGSEEEIEFVRQQDDAVDTLHGEIITYLGKVSGEQLSSTQSDEFFNLMEAVNCLESIGDIIETNLVKIGASRLEHRLVISQETQTVIRELHVEIVRALNAAMHAVTLKDEHSAAIVTGLKREINAIADAAAAHEAKRLVAQAPNRLLAYTIESDILQNLKRIYYFCKRMTRASMRG